MITYRLMRYYPAYLDISGRICLVVGGGSVATRKVQTLLNCGARVTVVSPEVTEKIHDLFEQGQIVLKLRPYHRKDLDSVFLVIGATNDESLNMIISGDAADKHLLCNIADRPEVCNFILPSIVHRGDLIISVSTSGKSPAMAKAIRQELEKQFGQEYADFLRLMGAIRKKLLSQAHEPEAHKPIFERLINQGLLDMIRNNQTSAINGLLEDVLGTDFHLETLMEAAD